MKSINSTSSGDACRRRNRARLLGGTPAEVSRRYQDASPLERLPTGRRQSLVHGEDDDIVPVRQSEGYAAAAEAAGDPVTLVTVPNAGHFQLIDIHPPAYGQVLAQIRTLVSLNPA